MKTIVSVLVPVYGVEKYIEKCCRTLFEQTYSNIEYIFVDDCSPDNSIPILLQVLKEYPERISCTKVIRHEKNKGLAGARNTAIAHARGEYITHVDSDDYLDRDAISQLINVAQRTKSDVVVFDMKHVYIDKIYEEHQRISIDKVAYIKQLLSHKVQVGVCGKLYKRNLFNDFGVNFVENLNFGEDYVVTPRIMYHAENIFYYDRCLYYYTHVNSSSYTLSYKPQNIADLKRAIDILSSFFSQKEMKNEYDLTIREARLQAKVQILIAICLHRKTMWRYLPEAKELYLGERATISMSYKFVLWLSNLNWDTLLYLYVGIGFRIKQMIK